MNKQATNIIPQGVSYTPESERREFNNIYATLRDLQSQLQGGITTVFKTADGKTITVTGGIVKESK